MNQGLSMFTPFLLLILMIGMMYFLTIRPQKKRMKEMQKLRDELKVGDNVVTIGGIRGRVTALREDSFEIETGADHLRVEFLRTALSYVVTPVNGYEESQQEESNAEEV